MEKAGKGGAGMEIFAEKKIREALGKIYGSAAVRNAGHAADHGIGKRLNTAAQFWHNYSHLSVIHAQMRKGIQHIYFITSKKKKQHPL